MGGECEEKEKDHPKGRFRKEKTGEEGQRTPTFVCFPFSLD